MTPKKETRGFSNFGFSTILLSFVMICVVTSSALSLVSAHSDYKLSQKVADKNRSYYEAQEQAYAKPEAIDQINASGYYLYLKEPISENSELSIKLSIHYPKGNDDIFYEILEWKSVYERGLPEDEPLNLMD